MDPANNPYHAGAGLQPAELAGRDDEQGQLRTALRRQGAGHPANPLLLVGLRGVGKTVLLTRYRQIATDEAGWEAVAIEASASNSLRDELGRKLDGPLRQIARRGVTDKVRSAIQSVRHFKVGVALGATAPEFSAEVDLDHDREHYTGELGQDLVTLIDDIRDALEESETGILVTIDELHTLDAVELEALVRGLHHLGQNPARLFFVGAALPNIYGRLMDAPSYVERMFLPQTIRNLPEPAARLALTVPARTAEPSASFTPAACNVVLAASGLYPYFIQMHGQQAWDLAASPRISIRDAERAVQLGRERLDEGFFAFRMARGDRVSVHALSRLASTGDGPYPQTVLDAIGISQEVVAKLKDNGLIFSPTDDEVDFTTPMFGDYLRRRHPAMP